MTTRQERWRQRQLASGKCMRCPNKRDDPKLSRYCRACQDKRNATENARRQRKMEEE